jgi:preprotein translocase subunit SecG
MNWIGILLLIIHIIACSGLILIVLLQAGKGASVGAAFGGGASQTVFGARSATFIGRLTWVLAGVFMATSLLLTIILPWEDKTAGPGGNILQEETAPQPEPLQGLPGLIDDDASSGEVTPPAKTAPAPAAGEAGGTEGAPTAPPQDKPVSAQPTPAPQAHE